MQTCHFVLHWELRRTCPEDAIWAGDVNKDNSLDLQDTVMILKGALGIIILN